MKKWYFLKRCSTCQRISKTLQLDDTVERQDIQSQPITARQLDEMIALSGSAAELFSKRAVKYRSWGLHTKTLSEADYRQLLLEEYTFLKRPVLIWEQEIFIGNSKAVVALAQERIAR